MKILSSQAIHHWDKYTIDHEPISSIDLMERAAKKCAEWIWQHYFGRSFAIFCGPGNNGGDGLAIARLMITQHDNVSVYILETAQTSSEDFKVNHQRLKESATKNIFHLKSANDFPSLETKVVIDALYGSGLNRPLGDLASQLVKHINQSGSDIVAIDVPSGLMTDQSSKGTVVITATHTLSFQTFKLAFFMAENAPFTGRIFLLDIGLKEDYYNSTKADFEMIELPQIKKIYKARDNFSHKGDFGHALILAGSYGKIGAAVLATRACLRSGVGLLTSHIPNCGYTIMQTSIPEAMVSTDFNSSFLTKIEDDLSKYKAIGIGPGIGNASETKAFLRENLQSYKNPIVIDADALNIIASQKELFKLIPVGSILTPHPKEFERLFGQTDNEFDRVTLAINKAKELNIIIVLKGHNTLIATPDGKGFFNSTGNAGMATGGSGDVLTGILTGLLAQGYNSINAAILGVYLHGMAGDMAATAHSMEAMTAGDIIENLGRGFSYISGV